jgi:hypothetical protein
VGTIIHQVVIAEPELSASRLQAIYHIHMTPTCQSSEDHGGSIIFDGRWITAETSGHYDVQSTEMGQYGVLLKDLDSTS